MSHRRRPPGRGCATAQEPDAYHAGHPWIADLLVSAAASARRPAVRTACLLIGAVLIAEYLPLGIVTPSAVGWTALISAFVVQWIFCHRVIRDMCLQAAFAAFVCAWHADGRAAAIAGHLEPAAGPEEFAAVGSVETEPTRSERSISFVVNADSSLRGRQWTNGPIKLLTIVRLREADRGIAPLHVGDGISVHGTLQPFPRPRNPGEFDFGRYLDLNGVNGVLMVASKDSMTVGARPARHSWRSVLSRVQRALFAIFDTLHPPEHASFLKGVVWGFRAEIADDVRQSFIDTGTIHILAVSGSNVAFVVLALTSTLGLVRIPRRWMGWTASAGLLAYMLLTGSSASVTRATLMGLLVLGGRGFERRTDVYNSIAAVAVMLLLWDTNTLFDVGFQLSFSAVLSLVYFSGPLTRLLERITVRFEEVMTLRGGLTLAAVSCAAQIGTIPFTAYYFGRISIISLLANLVVVPVSGVNTILGFAEVGSALISPTAASWYAAVNDALVWFLLGFVHTAASVPGATISVGGLSVVAIVAYYLVVIGLFNLHRVNVAKMLLFGGLIAANVWLWWTLGAPAKPLLTVAFLDVGQGDAILISTPSGRHVLVDTGPGGRGADAGERVIVPYLRRTGITTVDALIITHAHDDHTGGMATLLKSTQTGMLFAGIGNQLPERLRALLKGLQGGGAQLDSLKNGDRIDIDQDVRLYVLGPTKQLSAERNFNARSVVIRLEYGSASMLLTGDLSEEGEEALLRKYAAFLRSDILKVGHHGSSTSTLPAFLETVRPREAIISVGQGNRFGHPSSKTLERLGRGTAKIRRTDLEGAVLLQSEGNGWSMVKWR